MKKITLKKNKEKLILSHHPWIFSGAIEKTEGIPDAGDIVMIAAHNNKFIGYGHFSPASQIRVRMLEYGEGTNINDEWFYNKILSAIERRKMAGHSNAQRLIFSESDFLPGLIVDRYDNYAVIQTLTQGMDKIKPLITDILSKISAPAGIIERNDSSSRELEGLPLKQSLLYGSEPEEPVIIHENDLKFRVDLLHGQKTGFYLDQRENRKIISQYSRGKNVLDCFSYTGGFSVYCLKEEASLVTRVDSSAEALDMGDKNIELNSFELTRSPKIEGNVFEILRKFRDKDKKFDMIILDPPKMAPTRATAKKAMRAYKDMNLLAIKLLNPNGLLCSFSCSGGITKELFKEILFWSAQDAQRDLQIIHQLFQAPDHPVRITFPESEYLKGFISRVI